MLRFIARHINRMLRLFGLQLTRSKDPIWPKIEDRLFSSLDKILPEISHLLSSTRRKNRWLKQQNLMRQVLETTSNQAASAVLGSKHQRRIAIVIPSFFSGAGGAEKVAGRLANFLARRENNAVYLIVKNKRGAELSSGAYPLNSTIQIIHENFESHSCSAKLMSLEPDILIAFGMHGFYERIPLMANALHTPYVLQECTSPDRMLENLNRANTKITTAERVNSTIMSMGKRGMKALHCAP